MKFLLDYLRSKVSNNTTPQAMRFFSPLNFISRMSLGRLSLLSAAVTIPLASGLYFRNRYNKLIAITNEVEAFDNESFIQLNEQPLATLFEPLDKLYLMHEPRYADFAVHREIRNRLQRQAVKINLLSHELQSFRWFKTIGNSTLKEAEDKLGAILTRNVLTDEVNNALYHLKTKLYTVAEGSISRAIRILTNYTTLGFTQRETVPVQLSQTSLTAHTFNIAAKVARGQNDLEKSDAYYEQALQHQPNNREIVGSQIALWGDMAWEPGDKSNPEKLRRVLEDEKYFSNLTRLFSGYGLGLANLSWELLRASEERNFIRLDIDADKQRWCIDTAYDLAKQSVPLIAALEEHRRSANGLLFLGIAQMKRGEHDEALKSFDEGLKLESNYPSLLRRRALALKALGRWSEAYWASQQARLELSYRMRSRDVIPSQYKGWLSEIELKILPEIQAKVEKEINSPEGGKLCAAVNLLTKAQYSQAYEILKDLPGVRADQIRGWLLNDARFKRVSSGSTYQFIPHLKQEWLLRLGMYQHPTPYTLSALSIAAYEVQHGQPGALPPRWEEIGRSSELIPESRRCGYLAIACRHKDTGQIVIAHGGTDPQELVDFLTDFELGLGKDFEQLKWATEFVCLVSQRLMEAKPESANRKFNSVLPFIYHVGHSLGGDIAGYLACTLTATDPHHAHYAVGLDNPSTLWVLDRFYFNSLMIKIPKDSYRNFPVTSFLSRPSLINCAGGRQLGQVVHLPVYHETAAPLQPVAINQLKLLTEKWVNKFISTLTGRSEDELATYKNYLQAILATANTNLQFHSKERIQATLDDSQETEIYAQPAQTYYANTWPYDLGQWLIFENQCIGSPRLTTHYSPQESHTKISQEVLSLIPLNQSLLPGFHEAIPLQVLETKLSEFLFKILDKRKETLSEDQKVWLKYIHPSVLDCLTLDEEKQKILIREPLTSWELLFYLRQQAYEAFRVEKMPWLSVLYSPLVNLPYSSVTARYGFFNPLRTCNRAGVPVPQSHATEIPGSAPSHGQSPAPGHSGST